MTGITISIIEAVQLFTGTIIGQSLLNGTIINKWKAYTKKDEEPYYFIKISITVEMMLLILQPYHGILISKAGL